MPAVVSKRFFAYASIAVATALSMLFLFGGWIGLFAPNGEFQFGIDTANGTVVAVAPHSAAADAGIRTGDRVDETRTPLNDRYVTAFSMPIDARETLRVMRGNQAHSVTLRARPLQLRPIRKLLYSARLTVRFIVVLVGVLLVLLRPSRITWGFFVFSVGLNSGTTAIYWLPLTVRVPLGSVAHAFDIAAYAGFLIFALRFPHDRVTGRWIVLERAIVPATLIMMVFPLIELWYALPAVAQNQAMTPSLGQVGEKAKILFAYSVYAAGIAALLQTYLHSDGDGRQRIRWIVFGFAMSLGSRLIIRGLLEEVLNLDVPLWLNSIDIAAPLAVPASVAYAVIRYRVLDVRFVISRAAVYLVLTSAILAIFTLIDWIIGKELAARKLAIVSEVVAAIAFGFGINGLHRTVDRTVDKVLFRKKRLGEQRLEELSHALPNSDSRPAIAAQLVEPANDLDLTFAGLFYREQADGFACESQIRWTNPEHVVRHIDAASIELLENTRSAVHGKGLSKIMPGIHELEQRPALVIPVINRGKVIALAFFGAHANGSDLEPEERKSLSALAVPAAAAYDHLEVADLRRELQAIRSGSAPPLNPLA